MNASLWVLVGGALGSLLRYWLAEACSRVFGHAFPWGTILVNVSGSFLIGLLAVFLGRLDDNARAAWTALLIVGFCGGYTTFSSFSLQTIQLLQARQWMAAGGNVLLSTLLCLAATAIGWMIASHFTPARAS